MNMGRLPAPKGAAIHLPGALWLCPARMVPIGLGAKGAPFGLSRYER